MLVKEEEEEEDGVCGDKREGMRLPFRRGIQRVVILWSLTWCGRGRYRLSLDVDVCIPVLEGEIREQLSFCCLLLQSFY